MQQNKAKTLFRNMTKRNMNCSEPDYKFLILAQKHTHVNGYFQTMVLNVLSTVIMKQLI